MEWAAGLEVALRGGAASLALILAAHWLRGGRGVKRSLGGLFGVSVAAYMLVSTPTTQVFLRPLLPVLILLAIFAAVFLWWFLLSLFDDDFRFRLWHWLPFAAFAITLPFRDYLVDTGLPDRWVNPVHQALVMLLLLHGLYLALRDLRGDLVEPRRLFRVAFAVTTAITGVIIAMTEVITFPASAPQHVLLMHAIALFLLSCAFALWGLESRDDLLPQPAEPRGRSPLELADQHDLKRLEALMGTGIWREEGMTISRLASHIDLPEHRLRRLINKGLGYRNFSAFINEYRIAEARRRLSDPAHRKVQILTIALELGYASIGPFNRAFKALTGVTPTEYRSRSIADS